MNKIGSRGRRADEDRNEDEDDKEERRGDSTGTMR